MIELTNVARLMMRSSFHFFMPRLRCPPVPILIGSESDVQVTEGSDQGVEVTCDYPRLRSCLLTSADSQAQARHLGLALLGKMRYSGRSPRQDGAEHEQG